MAEFTILLVEDDYLVGEIMTEILRDFGCDVQWVTSAQPALDRLAAGFMPDVMLSDIRMPGMSGVQLAREVKAKWPKLKIILMTGFTDECENIPIEHRPLVLFKPVDRDLLHRSVLALTA